MKRHLVASVTAAVVLTGCAQPEPEVTRELDPAFGAPAQIVVEDEPGEPSVAPPGGSADAGDASGVEGEAPQPGQDDGAGADEGEAPSAADGTIDDADEGGGGSDGEVEPSDPPAPPEDAGTSDEDPTPAPAEPDPSPVATPTTLVAVTDRTGDHGLEGPDNADLVAFELASLGNDLVATLTFDGALPDVPGDGEVYLAGVDLLEDDEGESAYQLFVVGNIDGWLAYLYVEELEGFVEYPGTFTIGGPRMTLTVPWNSVGSPTRGPVGVFAEWSRDRDVAGVGLNPSSNDKLDGQPHTFDRNP